MFPRNRRLRSLFRRPQLIMASARRGVRRCDRSWVRLNAAGATELSGELPPWSQAARVLFQQVAPALFSPGEATAAGRWRAIQATARRHGIRVARVRLSPEECGRVTELSGGFPSRRLLLAGAA